jgi:ZIP family zinc transporter
MTSLSNILFVALIPVATMLIGGAIAIVKQPSGNVRSFILHFAAGVVFSVVAVEILPDVLKIHEPLQIIIGFVLGSLLMIFIKNLTSNGEENKNTKSKIPWGLLIAIGVDIFIDGLLLGIAFHAGKTEGILLAIALSLELLSLGMATAAELNNRKVANSKKIFWIAILSLVFFSSATLGATLLNHLSHNTMETVLSFGLAALLFLVTEELLKEAHEEKETIWHTAAFFGGFLLFMILGMYV